MHLAFSLGLFSICFAHSNFQANLWWAFSFIRVSNCAQASPRSRLRQCYTVFACLMEAYGRTMNYNGAWGSKITQFVPCGSYKSTPGCIFCALAAIAKLSL
ncbi:unnamed protein product [Musa hybrid cultivar]